MPYDTHDKYCLLLFIPQGTQMEIQMTGFDSITKRCWLPYISFVDHSYNYIYVLVIEN